MATFTGDWTEGVTLHSSSTLANAASHTDDIDIDTAGYLEVEAQVSIAIASGSPAGNVVIDVLASPDSGSTFDTEPLLTVTIPFTATGTKNKTVPGLTGPYRRIKVTNNTGVSVTHASKYAGLKQVSA